MRSMPTARWIGASATSICMVEQLGLAMMPRVRVLRDGVRVHLADHQRDIVLVAEFGGVVDHHGTGRAARGACSRLTEPPAEKKAMSTPVKS